MKTPATNRRRKGQDGAAKRNRTSDLLITNQLLYRLSYSGSNKYSMKIDALNQYIFLNLVVVL